VCRQYRPVVCRQAGRRQDRIIGRRQDRMAGRASRHYSVRRVGIGFEQPFG
jgi:hypothetical protein